MKHMNQRETMKAIIYTEYGGPEVLTIQQVEKPSPKGNEVLIRVRAVSVNYGDVIARNFKNISPEEFNMPFLFWLLARFAFGLSKPKQKILGNTFAGEVEVAGTDVKLFKAGDKVFGFTGEQMGAYTEYLCVPENSILAAAPSNMTFEEASAVPYGAAIALNLLRKVNIQKGDRVLIIGASGSIGSAAVQLARHYYEAEVTGVCSTDRTEYVKNLGAGNVIDYKKEDVTKTGKTFHLIFDIPGKGSFSQLKGSLRENGIYLSASFKTRKLLQMLWTSITGGKKLVCALAVPKQADLIFIKELAEQGKITSIIDKTFSLEQTAEAHRYFEAMKQKGAIVITI